MIMLSTDAAMNTPEWIEWKRKHALRYAMRKWATDKHYEQMDICIEVERKLGVPDWLMARIHARRNWYLLLDNSYESLEAYIDATSGFLPTTIRRLPPVITVLSTEGAATGDGDGVSSVSWDRGANLLPARALWGGLPVARSCSGPYSVPG
jgi:hypothetical protein